MAAVLPKPDCEPTLWSGCYDDNWNGYIIPEAFSHPAKYARGLIQRIIETGLARGYWKADDLIGDPFGGIASGGIIAGYHGLNWLGVELEPRFVDLGNRNLAMHGPQFMQCGSSSVRLVQGDSRRFASIVGEACGIVTSPPWSAQMNSGGADGDRAGNVFRDIAVRTGRDPDSASKKAVYEQYGATPGQIGSLKSGTLEGIVTSPPFSEPANQPASVLQPGGRQGVRSAYRTAGADANDSYGKTNGQIGNLKSGELTGIVTSPPFEDSDSRKPGPCLAQACEKYGVGTSHAKQDWDPSAGNVGNTYWHAMRQVYEQCRLALKPGGVMAVVVKDYVKGGKRVPLCDQTATLLTSLGFEVFERCHAMLVKEDRHPSLFGGDEVKKTERKSFFRRLAEKKGSPPIDYEVVLWVRSQRDLFTA